MATYARAIPRLTHYDLNQVGRNLDRLREFLPWVEEYAGPEPPKEQL